MNFDQAISAHVQWKSKLAAYIAKPDHSLHAEIIAKDDQCELGKWIHGEGQKVAKMPDFQKLVADHARFHAAAADVVRKADAGQKASEEVALGAKSSYAAASNSVVTALMHMKTAA
jgi:methyl-accepting chemotaxis protein